MKKTEPLKLSDLKEGHKYYVCFVPDLKYARQAVFKAVINEFGGASEVYLRFRDCSCLIDCREIGIGRTKAEAASNYGRIRPEKHSKFLSKVPNWKTTAGSAEW